MKRRPNWWTRGATVLMVGSAAMAYYSIHTDNIWAVMLYSWCVGGLGMHVMYRVGERHMLDRFE